MNTTDCACTCGCCEGVEKLTPLPLANRPGLGALAYRAGTHATFLKTMLARLSTLALPLAPGDGPQLEAAGATLRPLTGLTTRDPADPAIALLDAWATLADVLTFYQERLANEGYLRTATERRSILELARLIGYELRPGVASTAYLAYTIDEDRSKLPPAGMETLIPAGSRAQSIPGPGELPQSFETAEDLRARTAWNKLQPRLTRPQTAASIRKAGLYFKGIATNLKPNDTLLIDFGSGAGAGRFMPVRVVEVTLDPAAGWTHVTVRSWMTTAKAVDAIRKLVEGHLSHVISPASVTAKSTVALLNKILATTDSAALAKLLESETLPALENVHEHTKNFAKLEPWLRAIIDDLQTALRDLVGSGLASADSTTNMAGAAAMAGGAVTAVNGAQDFLRLLKKPASLPPQNAARLERTARTAFPAGGDIFPRLLTTFRPGLRNVLAPALSNATVAKPAPLKVYAFRVTASLFGANAPQRLVVKTFPTIHISGPVGVQPIVNQPNPAVVVPAAGAAATPEPEPTSTIRTEIDDLKPDPDFKEAAGVLHLDGSYDKILPESYVVVDTPETIVTDESVLVFKADSVRAGPTRSAYGINGKETEIRLAPPVTGGPLRWFAKDPEAKDRSTAFLTVRQTVVFAQSELLELADAPVPEPVCGAELELNGYYEGLETGRWVIVAGERADVFDVHGEQVRGVRAAELAMLLSVSHRVAATSADDETPLPGDKTHTFVRLSTGLAYCYVRESVAIYGNVVKSTHGETRREVLGSGDAGKAMQVLALRQAPLTFVPAPTAAGATSTLVVRVNEVEWHETDTLAGLSSAERKFMTRTGDDGKIQVVFGNGREGARPPTGAENISAVYRNGIGQPGNVKAEQISLLVSRPLGAKEVINPIAASGGADREGRDQARRNAPVGVLALDRLVSVQDYADFARTFAGIGKASAAQLSDGQREVVHLTIAGANDIPIEVHSDLYQNLVRALRRLGDPHLPIEVELREMLSLIISARIGVRPDYAWEFVEPKVRAALFETFSFERRDLGQDVTTSEVLAAMQGVPGVTYVDLDHLCCVSEKSAEAELLKTINAGQSKLGEARPDFFASLAAAGLCAKHRIVVNTARVNDRAARLADRILPAQLAVLSSALPETLVLTEAKP